MWLFIVRGARAGSARVIGSSALSKASKRAFSGSQQRSIRSSHLRADQLSALKAKPDRLWHDIHHTAQWGAANRWGQQAEETGLTRLTLTPEDQKARNWFVDTCRTLGCSVHIDAIGNTFAIRPGIKNDVLPVFAGSHLDSQPMGGRFDGVLGVCAGVEALRLLDENEIQTEAPFGVVNWTNEEGARFPISMMGSGVWAGIHDLQRTLQLHSVASDKEAGVTVGQELDRVVSRGQVPASWQEGVKLGAHFELHIEQGPYLINSGRQIGIVEGVQGYRWFEVTVEGRAAHTGTTGFDDRADALYWASRLVVEARSIAEKHKGLASVGIIKSKPQSINTIPDKVILTLDVRHRQLEILTELCAELYGFMQHLQDNSSIRGSPKVNISATETFASDPVHFDADAVQCVEDSASQTFETMRMTSGAGHDSVNTQRRCPSAMIFVPCKDGVSHHPTEWSNKEDCGNGASVLVQSMLRFDQCQHGSGR